MIDLSNMSTSELRDLQAKVTVAIKDRGQAEASAAREQILAIAKNVGLSVGDLMGGIKAGKIKAVVPVRFRNKDDASKTWTGRGRQPTWIKEWVESGKSLDDLRV